MGTYSDTLGYIGFHPAFGGVTGTYVRMDSDMLGIHWDIRGLGRI